MKLFRRDPLRLAPGWAQPEWVERHVIPVACAFSLGVVLALLAAEAAPRPAGAAAQPGPSDAQAAAAARYACTAEASR